MRQLRPMTYRNTILYLCLLIPGPLLAQDAPSAGEPKKEAPSPGKTEPKSGAAADEMPSPPAERNQRQRLDPNMLRMAPAMRQIFDELIEQPGRSVVNVLSDGKRICLGTVVSADGYIATKASLLKGRLTCRVGESNTDLAATLLEENEQYDIALLHVDSKQLTPIEWSASTQPARGSLVASPDAKGQAHAVGVVSVEPRRFNMRQPRAQAQRGFMGVQFTAAAGAGVKIQRVVPDSGASRAGLKANDVVTQANGQTVKEPQQIATLIGKLKPTDKVQLKIKRGDESLDVTVTLGKIPGGSQSPLDRWGGGPFSVRRFGFPEVLAHDSVVAPSNVGGPLVDTQGNVVGLNISRTLRVTTYAIAASDARRVVQELMESATAPLEDAITSTADIRADGLAGSVVLCGSGPVSDDTLATFVRLAGRRDARISVLQLGGGNGDDGIRLAQSWRKLRGVSLQMLAVSAAPQDQSAEIVSALSSATGVWLDADTRESLQALTRDRDVVTGIRNFLDRGGVLGGSVWFAEAAAVHSLSRRASRLRLLPQCAVLADESTPEQLQTIFEAQPTAMGIRIAPETALVCRGRRLFTVGDGAVSIEFAKSGHYPDKTVRLERRSRQADFTALRRFAVQRTEPHFPSAKAAQPKVRGGTLMIIGGGGMPKGAVERFLAEAGGKEAKIVVIPIAMPEPLPERDPMAEALKQAGAQHVTVLSGRTPAEVDSEESLASLRDATGIWFGGGRQWRFIDAYEGTQAAMLMHDVLKRGGIIGGSSAGASIQGEYMARGNPLGSNAIMADGYERGLGFLPGVAIDQHFSQRKRFADLASLVKRYPQLLGIGIDEATAIVVKGRVADVIGRRRVCFYDQAPESDAFTSVETGKRYDLLKRQPLPDEGE